MKRRRSRKKALAGRRHRRKKALARRPQGAPRHIFESRLPFTDEAYHILEAAATLVLKRLGILERGYITKEDLIDICWLRTFFYVKTPADLKGKMFLNAMTAMARYAKEMGQRTYVPLGDLWDDDEDTQVGFDTPDLQELNDPAVQAELNDALEQIRPRMRRVLVEHFRGGRTYKELFRRRRRPDRTCLYHVQRELRRLEQNE